MRAPMQISATQLAIFVRGIDNEFHIIEELVSLVALNEKTSGADVQREVELVMNDIGMKYEQLFGLTTDGAPSMVWRIDGVIALMEKAQPNAGIANTLIKTQCIIHQEALCAKSLKMQDMMNVVGKHVNFVRKQGLNYRWFQQFLLEINTEYGDLLYYSEVHWLSRGAMLHRVDALRNEIVTFVEQKGFDVSELLDPCTRGSEESTSKRREK